MNEVRTLLNRQRKLLRELETIRRQLVHIDSVTKRELISYGDSDAIPLIKLDFSARVQNALRREGITNVGELCAYSEFELLEIRNFGQHSLDEVKDALFSLGREPKEREFTPLIDAVTFSDEELDAGTAATLAWARDFHAREKALHS
ncbi:MAG TPA: DNA-directed RNA polymerase subunit alpha C-terminal domain-containing protein [Galbitalea sp.]|jgi:DNA-directed RNA polymerase alpha subunit